MCFPLYYLFFIHRSFHSVLNVMSAKCNINCRICWQRYNFFTVFVALGNVYSEKGSNFEVNLLRKYRSAFTLNRIYLNDHSVRRYEIPEEERSMAAEPSVE